MTELTLNLTFQHHTQKELENAFKEACRSGYLDIVQSILTYEKLEKLDIPHSQKFLGFRLACSNGHVDIAQYLLTCPSLKQEIEYNQWQDVGFICACEYGRLDIIRCLLTSDDFVRANINVNDNTGIQVACQNGHLEVVKYLLTSPELTEHADIHANYDASFEWACQKRYVDIVTFLLLLTGDQCIDFERTHFNFDWALNNQQHDIVIMMTLNLKKNNTSHFLHRMSQLQQYHHEYYQQIIEFDKDTDEIHSSVPDLFF